MGSAEFALGHDEHDGHEGVETFSWVDVRVDVKIPGGVHAYVVDLRGKRCGPSFVSGQVVGSPLQYISADRRG